ncbi:MAG: transporter substrate-binding domain-containing protein [Bermanella sp.]
MKKVSGLTSLILLLMVSNSHALDKLSCAVTGAFPPLHYMENNILLGMDVDLFHLAANNLNIKVDIVTMPLERILHKIKVGSLDCMFAAFKTPERALFMDYTSVPIHVSSLVFFEKIGSQMKFNSLEDLNGLTVGLMRGFKTSKGFDTALNKGMFKVEFVNNFEQNFRKLSYGRIDLVLVNRYVGGRVLKVNQIKNVQPLPVPYIEQPAYLTFSKKKQLKKLVPLFDAEFSNAMKNGQFQKITHKYIAN